MNWLNWLPWRFIVRRVAHSHGFLDPVALLARLHRFAQPSEVGEPVELLRAGVVFHARGLINSRVVQHNLDWVWPYWIEQQFNPRSTSFVPRAFSISHINLTHRNWTAVGIPDCNALPIVDPRGLVTPFYEANAKTLTGARDIVGAIVVDFRALDTLVEIAVFALAGLGITMLLRQAARRDDDEGSPVEATPESEPRMMSTLGISMPSMFITPLRPSAMRTAPPRPRIDATTPTISDSSSELNLT